MPRRTKEEEMARVEALWSTEQALLKEGFDFIAGVDEAGRGPLAGPVYAGAVILPQGLIIEGINDSKKLSPKKREELYEIICEKAVCYATAEVDEKIIDEINILNATYLAMQKAVAKLSKIPEFVLVDGNRKPEFSMPCETIVKGDSKSISIAAASILAKVERDRMITKMAECYPQYGFEKHKGYGTKQHTDAILKYGPSPIHRLSFLKKLLTDDKRGI